MLCNVQILCSIVIYVNGTVSCYSFVSTGPFVLVVAYRVTRQFVRSYPAKNQSLNNVYYNYCVTFCVNTNCSYFAQVEGATKLLVY